MAGYASIDPAILRWVRKNHFSLFTQWAGREARFVYLSSQAGECYQISIEPPTDQHVAVHAFYVEGMREIEPEQNWFVTVSDLGSTLDEAFDTVSTWMKPSEIFIPKT